MKKAVILFSGGLDSTTCLAIAKSQGYVCHTLSFNYSQRHAIELKFAARLAEHYAVAEHRVVNLDINWGHSALIDHSLQLPEHQTKIIPITYVPARNTIFLSMALSYAEAVGAYDIFLGASSIDYSGYPDCRPEYLAAFTAMANLATQAAIEGNPVTIHAPLVHLSKAATIQQGIALGVDYSLTVSCYQANEQGRACGHCDSCMLRKKGFQAANITDPTLYV